MTLSSGVQRADRRPDLLEPELGQAVGDDPLGGQQAHQAEELGLGQRPDLRPLHQRDDRLDQRVVLLLLRLGHLDRDAGVGPGRELVEDVLADPADHAAPEPVAEGVEVAHAGDLAAAVGVDRVQGAEPPLGLQGHVVDPLDDRGQLLDPVLHRRAGQDQAIGRGQPLDRERRLGRPVLDPLRLVEHDQVGRPAADRLQVADQLLIVDDEEPGAVRLVDRLAFGGGAVDDADRQVGEAVPLAGPLRLEARRGDDQAAADPPGRARGCRSRRSPGPSCPAPCRRPGAGGPRPGTARPPRADRDRASASAP